MTEEGNLSLPRPLTSWKSGYSPGKLWARTEGGTALLIVTMILWEGVQLTDEETGLGQATWPVAEPGLEAKSGSGAASVTHRPAKRVQGLTLTPALWVHPCSQREETTVPGTGWGMEVLPPTLGRSF